MIRWTPLLGFGVLCACQASFVPAPPADRDASVGFGSSTLEGGSPQIPTWPQDGTAEATALLVFLDHELTDIQVLEHSVGLDMRATHSLLKYRDGSDGERGTLDDNGFDTVWEVDNIPGVAESGLTAMVDYALDHGFPMGPYRVSYDDVQMSDQDAWDVLYFVNTTPLEVLDDEVGLDVRTVDALEGMRPLHSPGTFAALPYVGPVAWHKVLNALESLEP